MEIPNFQRATLLERVDFTKDVAVFKFKPEHDFTFTPGQYATIAFPDGEKLIQRPYSVVSSPLEPYIEMYIDLVPEGKLTPRLWELRPNDTILFKNKIIGAFVLQEKQGMKNHIMCATVTGVGPYISIARTQKRLLDEGKITEPHRLMILHGASHSGELGIYKDEMSALAEQCDWLQYIPTISRHYDDPSWTGEVGRVDDLMRKYADGAGMDYTNSIGYACGNPQMIENVKAMLYRARFPKEQIKEEKYFIAQKTA